MSLWGITVYFNPSKYHRRYTNYKAFRKSSKAQGLNLITVELALNKQPFVLSSKTGLDAEKMIQVRSNSILWHKEQLINIGLKHLPKDCDYVAWLDCDLIFTNKNWVKDTSNKLKKHTLVQPFESVVLMNADNKSVQSKWIAYANHSKKVGKDERGRTWGYGWACRKDYILKCKGFFPYNIIGGGDTVQKSAFGLGPRVGAGGGNRYSRPHLNEIKKYGRSVKKLSSSKDISSTKGMVKHLWHGDSNSRQYGRRHEILKRHNFNPSKHIIKNKYDCLEWSKNVPKGLRRDVQIYFNKRNEDGKRNKKHAPKLIKSKKLRAPKRKSPVSKTKNKTIPPPALPKKSQTIKNLKKSQIRPLISNKTIVDRSHIKQRFR